MVFRSVCRTSECGARGFERSLDGRSCDVFDVRVWAVVFETPLDPLTTSQKLHPYTGLVPDDHGRAYPDP